MKHIPNVWFQTRISNSDFKYQLLPSHSNGHLCFSSLQLFIINRSNYRALVNGCKYSRNVSTTIYIIKNQENKLPYLHSLITYSIIYSWSLAIYNCISLFQIFSSSQTILSRYILEAFVLISQYSCYRTHFWQEQFSVTKPIPPAKRGCLIIEFRRGASGRDVGPEVRTSIKSWFSYYIFT